MIKKYINCVNTGDKKPKTGSSWIENYHILRNRKGLPTSLNCVHCAATPVEGCHVKLKNCSAQYIVPMCHECNISKTHVLIADSWAEPVDEVSNACSEINLLLDGICHPRR